ncbi:MAG: biotin--[acetyl-CoA-carboxylase] ligase [Chitinophagaceae bacterium]|nr:biotin--[acetyl-CoA-carboxylase] ligase [Chitinophagaceae bacterium]MCW5904430.1 biotin--[acetyl-CoA-carboxylase] ligase [Chitinophagaceae bacterium]
MSKHSTHNNSLSTIGSIFIELTSINSTNTYAMQQIKAKLAEHGVTYFAHSQTNGKGSRGKSWHSQTGSNIVLSTILDVSFIPLSKQFFISIVAALSTHDFFTNYVHNGISIKWPNDIYYLNHKIAGILIENNVKGNKMQWSVVGIGANINQTIFPDALANATSLSLITQEKYAVISLSHHLCSCLEKRYRQLLNGEEAALLQEYNEKLFKRNEKIKLKTGNVIFSCTVKHVTESGLLVVKNGKEESFDYDDVQWIIE